MDLITRRVIERLENGNVTDEVLQEYTDPDSEKYERWLTRSARNCISHHSDSTDLTICLRRVELRSASSVHTAGMVRSKLRMTAMLYATDSIIYKIINL